MEGKCPAGTQGNSLGLGRGRQLWVSPSPRWVTALIPHSTLPRLVPDSSRRCQVPAKRQRELQDALQPWQGGMRAIPSGDSSE